MTHQEGIRLYKHKLAAGTERQWNESSHQCSQGLRGRGLRLLGTKTFSRVVDLAGQTLMVNCFHSFVEVSPPVFIYNLNHIKCIVGAKEAEAENGVCQGATKDQEAIAGFPQP